MTPLETLINMVLSKGMNFCLKSKVSPLKILQNMFFSKEAMLLIVWSILPNS